MTIGQFNLAILQDFTDVLKTPIHETVKQDVFDSGPLLPPSWATLPFIPEKVEIVLNNSLILVVPSENSLKMRISSKSIRLNSQTIVQNSKFMSIEGQLVIDDAKSIIGRSSTVIDAKVISLPHVLLDCSANWANVYTSRHAGPAIKADLSLNDPLVATMTPQLMRWIIDCQSLASNVLQAYLFREDDQKINIVEVDQQVNLSIIFKLFLSLSVSIHQIELQCLLEKDAMVVQVNSLLLERGVAKALEDDAELIMPSQYTGKSTIHSILLNTSKPVVAIAGISANIDAHVAETLVQVKVDSNVQDVGVYFDSITDTETVKRLCTQYLPLLETLPKRSNTQPQVKSVPFAVDYFIHVDNGLFKASTKLVDIILQTNVQVSGYGPNLNVHVGPTTMHTMINNTQEDILNIDQVQITKQKELVVSSTNINVAWNALFQVRVLEIVTDILGMVNSISKHLPKSESKPITRQPMIPLLFDLKTINVSASFSKRSKFSLSIERVRSKDSSTHVVEVLIVKAMDQTMVLCPAINVMLNYHPIINSDFYYLHNKLRNQVTEETFMTVEFDHLDIKIPNGLYIADATDDMALAIEVLKQFKFESDASNEPPNVPRIYLIMKNVIFEVEDNPIDSSLVIHQQIWEAEVAEREHRERLFNKKINELSLPHDKVEKMRVELRNQNGMIYVDKIKHFKKHNTRPKGIFTVQVRSVELDIIPEHKTKEQVREWIISKDDSPIPANVDFDIAIRLKVGMKFEHVTISMRNYPLPFWKNDRCGGEATVALIQTHDIPNAPMGPVRKWKFDNDGHEYTIQQPQHLPKLYFDVNGEVRHNDFIVGLLSYIPTFEDLAIAFERLSPIKPYQMFWWDQMRYLTHGTYALKIYDSRVRLLSGINPYDPTDYLDMYADYTHGSYKTGQYRIEMHQFRAINHPSLSNFPAIAELPYLLAIIGFSWHTPHMKDPYNHHFNFWDEKKNNEFRATEMKVKFDMTFRPDETATCSHTKPTIMFDPLTTSWMIRFATFLETWPLQVYLGKAFKYMMPKREDFEVLDFISHIIISVDSKDLQVMWSNGQLTDNYLLRISCGDVNFFGDLGRDTLPDIKVPKVKRKKVDMLPVSMHAHCKNLGVDLYACKDHMNDDPPEFGYPFLASVNEIIFRQNTDKVFDSPLTKQLDTLNEFVHQLVVDGLHALWSSEIRDAVFTFIDISEQFMFNELEVTQGKTLRKIEKQLTEEREEGIISEVQTPSPDNELLSHLLREEKTPQEGVLQQQSFSILAKPFAVVLLKPQAIMLAEETSECMIIRAELGRVQIHDVEEKKRLSLLNEEITQNVNEVITVLDNVKGFMTDINNSTLDSCFEHTYDIVLTSGSWTCTYTETKSEYLEMLDQAPKNVIVQVPQMDLHFTSNNLQSLIDIITNTLVPKKLARSVLLEDKMETIAYQSKLAPEFWQDADRVKRKVESVRREIRALESQLSMALRELGINPKNTQVVTEIERLEETIRKRKMVFHGMKENLQMLVIRAMQEKEQQISGSTVTKPDLHVQVTLHDARFQLLDSLTRRPFMELILTLFQASIIKNLDYSILQTFTLHHFFLNNLLPNPSFAQVIIPYDKSMGSITPRALNDDDCMLRVTANKRSPIGGIGGFEHFEIDVTPIIIQLTYEIYKAIWDYAFPLASTKPNDEKILTTNTSTVLPSSVKVDEHRQDDLRDLLERRQSNTSRHQLFKKFNSRRDHDLLDDIDLMKNRASSTVIFNYVRIAEVKLFVTYHGVPESVDTLELIKYVTNLEQCEVHLKSLVYNSKTWTWTNFFENLRNDIIRQSLEYIIPQTVKSVTTSKFRDIGRIFRVSPSTTTPSQLVPKTSPRVLSPDNGGVTVLDDDKEPANAKTKILKSAKKYQQQLSNMKDIWKRKNEIDDTSIKKMLMFGAKTSSAEGLKKSFFGKSYKKQANSEEQVTSPRFSGHVEGALTEDLFDALMLDDTSTATEEDESQ
jgi:hypothetical protein